MKTGFKPFAYWCDNCQRTHYLNRMKEVCPAIQREMNK